MTLAPQLVTELQDRYTMYKLLYREAKDKLAPVNSQHLQHPKSKDRQPDQQIPGSNQDKKWFMFD